MLFTRKRRPTQLRAGHAGRNRDGDRYAAPRAAVDGFTRQVAWAGIDVQANATVPGTPAAEESNSGYTASEPEEIVAVVLPFAFSAKSTPVPVSCRLCGDDAALSVTVKVPVRAADA